MKVKKHLITHLAKGVLANAFEEMNKGIEKALNSGALNLDSWNENVNPMILPKIIAIALLEDSATQLNGKGTCFEKEMSNEIKNLKLFL
jgi:hypothetical protein